MRTDGRTDGRDFSIFAMNTHTKKQTDGYPGFPLKVT